MEDFYAIIAGMPAEMYDFYLQESPPPVLRPPPPFSFIVQKALRGGAWHDLQYDMFSMSNRNRPHGNGVYVINSNIILKCHMFF